MTLAKDSLLWVPYGGVVGHFHWLTERQFLDAVAVAMITPARWSQPVW